MMRIGMFIGVLLWPLLTTYGMINIILIIVGASTLDGECEKFRNYEKLFPGKQVGCWLAKPVEENKYER